MLQFISLVWLFLNLGPTITWNWKLKQWNIRRLHVILTLEPVAYNLRHFLRFIFSFSILSLLTCLFLSYGFVIRHGTAWYLMWPSYLRREGFHKKNYRTLRSRSFHWFLHATNFYGKVFPNIGTCSRECICAVWCIISVQAR